MTPPVVGSVERESGIQVCHAGLGCGVVVDVVEVDAGVGDVASGIDPVLVLGDGVVPDGVLCCVLHEDTIVGVVGEVVVRYGVVVREVDVHARHCGEGTYGAVHVHRVLAYEGVVGGVQDDAEAGILGDRVVENRVVVALKIERDAYVAVVLDSVVLYEVIRSLCADDPEVVLAGNVVRDLVVLAPGVDIDTIIGVVKGSIHVYVVAEGEQEGNTVLVLFEDVLRDEVLVREGQVDACLRVGVYLVVLDRVLLRVLEEDPVVVAREIELLERSVIFL